LNIGAAVAKPKKRRRKHIPQRTCVGCRSVQEKRSLIRIVRTADGVKVDPQGKMAGRGAYLHNQRSCWRRGLDDRLSRALKTTLSDEDIAGLTAHLEDLPEGDSDKAAR